MEKSRRGIWEGRGEALERLRERLNIDKEEAKTMKGSDQKEITNLCIHATKDFEIIFCTSKRRE